MRKARHCQAFCGVFRTLVMRDAACVATSCSVPRETSGPAIDREMRECPEPVGVRAETRERGLDVDA